jgi:hypothetical protein
VKNEEGRVKNEEGAEGGRNDVVNIRGRTRGSRTTFEGCSDAVRTLPPWRGMVMGGKEGG